MAISKKEFILELIENGSSDELKFALRTLADDEEGVDKMFAVFQDLMRKKSTAINGSGIFYGHARWLLENTTTEERRAVAEYFYMNASAEYTADHVKELIVGMVKALQSLKYSTMERIVGAWWKILGGRRVKIITFGNPVNFIKFKPDEIAERHEKFEKSLKELRDSNVKNRESKQKVRELLQNSKRESKLAHLQGLIN